MITDQNSQEENQILTLTDRELFTKIWSSPRVVFKYLNDFRYDKYVVVLLVLAGIGRALDRAAMRGMGDKMSLLAVVTLCVILGGLLGWLSYYIYAALMSWTGKWLQGKGNTDSLLRMLAYAMVPSIISLVFLIPQIAVFGNEVFKSEMNFNESGLTSTIIFYSSAFMEFMLGMYTIVLAAIGISEVQKISIGKSILNMILPGLVILVPILFIVLMIKLMS